MSPKAIDRLHTELKQKLAQNKIAFYKPYPKQLVFHAAGKTFRERLLMAGNQLGKTIAGGSEHAIHATGIYPKWWPGKVFDKPIVSWAAGVTGEVTRDSVQRILAGRANQLGTGTIPKDRIKDHTLKRGVADAIDTIYVKHGGGGDIQSGESIITFKSYDQGRTKFQSETLDWVWFDEEPDLDIYIEGLTRTNNTDGCVAMTFTPLFGMSQVVKRFTVEKPASTTVIQMGIEDAEHYTPERRAEIIASYPAHERDARAKGIPVLGSGAVFPIAETEFVIDPIPIPAHWAQISAIDFGWDHPFAWSKIAHDRDTDTVYIFDEYARREATPKDHVADLRSKPDFEWVPVVWPHDGLQHDKQSGIPLAETYRQLGLPMLQDKFSNAPAAGEDEGTGGNGIEAGIMEMLTRMQTGRLKVFSTCQKWLSEFRLYHRVNGKIEAIDDDLISASRLCVMSLRFAETKPLPRRRSVGLVGVSNW